MLLREGRERAGRTQRELADEAGVTRSVIDALESGRNHLPSPDVLNRLQRVLPVAMRDLVEAMGYALEQDELEVQRLRTTRDEVAETLAQAMQHLLGLRAAGPAEQPSTPIQLKSN